MSLSISTCGVRALTTFFRWIHSTVEQGLFNIAFAAALQLGDIESCVSILLATDRAPEAALFARTYAPSQTSRAVKSWRGQLEAAKKSKQANAVADPEEFPQEFAEGWEAALERERNGGVVEELVQLENGREAHDEESEQAHLANGVEGLSLENGHRTSYDGEDDDLMGRDDDEGEFVSAAATGRPASDTSRL